MVERDLKPGISGLKFIMPYHTVSIQREKEEREWRD